MRNAWRDSDCWVRYPSLPQLRIGPLLSVGHWGGARGVCEKHGSPRSEVRGLPPCQCPAYSCMKKAEPWGTGRRLGWKRYSEVFLCRWEQAEGIHAKSSNPGHTSIRKTRENNNTWKWHIVSYLKSQVKFPFWHNPLQQRFWISNCGSFSSVTERHWIQ